MESEPQLFNVVLVGNFDSGKSNLLLRYAEDRFDNSVITTIGINFRVKRLEVDGRNIRLNIWDTAGQERFWAISRSFFRGCHGVLVVYDTNNRYTFDSISYWVTEVQENTTPDCCCFLIGNQHNFTRTREVSYEEGEALANEFGIRFFETCPRDNTNVNEVFLELTRQMLASQDRINNSENSSNNQAQNISQNSHHSINLNAPRTQERSDFC